MRGYFIVVLFLFILVPAAAQTPNRQVTGRVLDSNTLKPLPFANVYVNNTTVGTSTNDKGEFILRNIPVSNPEIIFSFLGYQSYQIRVNLQDANQKLLVIKLIANPEQLSEIEVKESRDKTWEKQLRKFETVFLGDNALASTCKIKNSWAIDFTTINNNVLIAKAAIPLEIENKGLGYKIFFQLKDFKYTGTNYSIIGNARFEEELAPDTKTAKEWMRKREEIYLGSAKHLIKSIVDHKIRKEGFVIYRDKELGKSRTNNFSFELEHNLVPYDTANLVTADLQPGVFKILIKDKIEVHYIYSFSKSGFYKDISHAVSWLEVKGSYLKVNSDGIILNLADVTISGDMSENRVGGMLPLDYKKGDIIQIQSHETVSAKRMQERVYLHTDKPYYYPGENIWFSAYMNYRAQNVADSLSKVLYVDLLNDKKEIVKSMILPLDNGRSMGSFKMANRTTPGDYFIRAYTEWMKNYGVDQFFYKAIPVLSLVSRPVDNPAPLITSADRITLSVDKPSYGKRDKVKMTLALAPENENARVSFSIAVTDEQQVIPVDDPASILNKYDFTYDFSKMLSKFKYPIERGIGFSGTYYDKKGKAAKEKLTLVQDGFANIFDAFTNDKGVFSKKDLLFYDSVKFAFQPAVGKVILKNKEVVALPSTMPSSTIHLVRTDSVQRKFSYDTSTTILLQTVEVKGERTKSQYQNNYSKPDYYIKGESMIGYQSVAAAIPGKIPTYKLTYYDGHWFIIWGRGDTDLNLDNSTAPVVVSAGMAKQTKTASITSTAREGNIPVEPALYVDGALVVVGSGETAGDRLSMLNPATIDHIEVSSLINSGLGSNGTSGAIAVFSKHGTNDFKAVPVFKVRGFDRIEDFKGPDYEHTVDKEDKEDTRSTLYWNPKIDLASDRKTIDLYFFTSDEAGKYKIVIEGVTYKGVPFRTETEILVKE